MTIQGLSEFLEKLRGIMDQPADVIEITKPLAKTIIVDINTILGNINIDRESGYTKHTELYPD